MSIIQPGNPIYDKIRERIDSFIGPFAEPNTDWVSAAELNMETNTYESYDPYEELRSYITVHIGSKVHVEIETDYEFSNWNSGWVTFGLSDTDCRTGETIYHGTAEDALELAYKLYCGYNRMMNH